MESYRSSSRSLKGFLMKIILLAALLMCVACANTGPTAELPGVHASSFIYDPKAKPVESSAYIYDAKAPELRASKFLITNM
jgi:hypothetical protein